MSSVTKGTHSLSQLLSPASMASSSEVNEGRSQNELIIQHTMLAVFSSPFVVLGAICISLTCIHLFRVARHVKAELVEEDSSSATSSSTFTFLSFVYHLFTKRFWRRFLKQCKTFLVIIFSILSIICLLSILDANLLQPAIDFSETTATAYTFRLLLTFVPFYLWTTLVCILAYKWISLSQNYKNRKTVQTLKWILIGSNILVWIILLSLKIIETSTIKTYPNLSDLLRQINTVVEGCILLGANGIFLVASIRFLAVLRSTFHAAQQQSSDIHVEHINSSSNTSNPGSGEGTTGTMANESSSSSSTAISHNNNKNTNEKMKKQNNNNTYNNNNNELQVTKEARVLSSRSAWLTFFLTLSALVAVILKIVWEFFRIRYPEEQWLVRAVAFSAVLVIRILIIGSFIYVFASRRGAELKEDAHNLPQTGKFSRLGHVNQLVGKQARLRKLLEEYNTKGCGSGGGGGDGIPADAYRFASNEEQANRIAREKGVDMFKLARNLGIGVAAAAALVALVFASGGGAAVAAMSCVAAANI